MFDIVTDLDAAVANQDLALFRLAATVNDNTRRAAIYASVTADWRDGILFSQTFEQSVWTQALMYGVKYLRCDPEKLINSCPEVYRFYCTNNHPSVPGLEDNQSNDHQSSGGQQTDEQRHVEEQGSGETENQEPQGHPEEPVVDFLVPIRTSSPQDRV